MKFTLFFIFLPFFCTSCATFSHLDSAIHLKKNDFEGSYEGNLLRNMSTDFPDAQYLEEHKKDTLYFQLKFLNKKELIITQFLNNKILFEKIKSYTFKRDKYLYIEGYNSRTGITFIFDRVETTSFRLSKDKK